MILPCTCLRRKSDRYTCLCRLPFNLSYPVVDMCATLKTRDLAHHAPSTLVISAVFVVVSLCGDVSIFVKRILLRYDQQSLIKIRYNL